MYFYSFIYFNVKLIEKRRKTIFLNSIVRTPRTKWAEDWIATFTSLNTLVFIWVSLYFPTLRVLFPGGAASFSASGGYADAAWKLYQRAVSKNNAGDYFPVWGTCLGFELLTYVATRQHNILTACDSENVALPLKFKLGRSALIFTVTPTSYSVQM